MAITYRNTKGARLTSSEVDANFLELVQRITELEENGATGRGIDHFEIVGNQLTVYMTDNTQEGPYTVPVSSWNFKGAWLPATTYAVLDTVTNGTGLYVVIYPHTSDAVFDPFENDGNGHDYYRQLISIPDGGVWRGEYTSAENYRVNDEFKVPTAIDGIFDIYRVLQNHETAYPFDASRQIGSADVYQFLFTTSNGATTFKGGNIWLTFSVANIHDTEPEAALATFVSAETCSFIEVGAGLFFHMPTPPASALEFSVKVNGTQYGTVTVATDGTTTVDGSEIAVGIDPGDLVTVHNPATLPGPSPILPLHGTVALAR